MFYNVITQDGMTVGQSRTLEDARDLAEDVDGVVKPLEEAKTSTELYSKIQAVIDEMDTAFFSGKGKAKIPELVFAINNQVRSCVTAFVSPDALYDKKNAKKLQYLGINPRHLDRDISGILATICHELCHIYENAYIHIPRGSYHDKQWAELMKDCGLNPVYLNKSKTAVSTEIVEGGIFEDFVKTFREKHGEDYFNIVAYSSELERRIRTVLGIEDGDDEEGELKADNADKPVKKYNRNKVKYTCPSCGVKVWGKAGLRIACEECSELFDEEENDEKGEEK